MLRSALLLLALVVPPAQGPAADAGRYLTTDDGVRIWYRIVGEGRETVLVPNGSPHGRQLDGLARGRRLVLFDSRGRGRSDTVPPARVSLERQLKDVDNLRSALGAEPVAVIGWSGAGMEMFVYALRYPERVTRLVQLAPVAPRFEPYSAIMMDDRARRTDTVALAALNTRAAAGEFRDKPAELCRLRQSLQLPATFAARRNASVAPDLCEFPTEWPDRIGAYFSALLGSIGSWDWRDSLAKVGIPRLVIHGDQDNTPLEGNLEWVTGQPNARLLVVSPAGHWPQYEQAGITLPAIDSFLAGGWPSGARQVPPPAGATAPKP